MTDVELRFKIGAYTPDSIPLARLGQYMADLGAMLGEPSEVHFARLEHGSTVIVHRVTTEAFPKVVERVKNVRRGEGELVHLNAFRSLNKRLKEDNGDGRLLLEKRDDPLLVFPGRNTPAPIVSEPVVQTGSIDGHLIALGGRDETVPVRLQDGDTIHRCTTSRAVARQLAQHLFGAPLRLVGEGKWLRSDEGVWTLENFKVLSFEALEDRPMEDVVEALRRIPNDYTAEAWDELLETRSNGDDAG